MSAFTLETCKFLSLVKYELGHGRLSNLLKNQLRIFNEAKLLVSPSIELSAI